MTGTQTLYAAFAARIDAALAALERDAVLPQGMPRGAVSVEPPRDPAHGDLATNAAMVLAKPAGTNPRALAEQIVARLTGDPLVTSAEIAGPGFINLRLADASWIAELRAIAALGAGYGRSTMGAGRTVNVEYVSANPTGPMHMGHCRGAVVGDALATLLEFAGHQVVREYYVNDAGRRSRRSPARRTSATARPSARTIAIPEGLLSGRLPRPIGQALAAEFGDRYRRRARERVARACSAKDRRGDDGDGPRRPRAARNPARRVLVRGRAAAAPASPRRPKSWLRAHDLVYDGLLEAPKGKTPEDWEPVELPLFRSTRFGDDQDRPIRKSDGSWTYFGADLAYHMQKAQAADELIDIWGADHAGTVKRIRAAVAALSEGQGKPIPFDVKLVQMVQLLRGGEPVKMSKRAGTFVTLADVVEEVGKDVVRFTMLTRKPDAQMDFDFAKVVEASKDNPVFYVQYAHARIHSTLRKAACEGIAPSDAALERLGADELALVKLAAQFPREVEAAAKAREPHRIAFYLYDLAALPRVLEHRQRRSGQAHRPARRTGSLAAPGFSLPANRAGNSQRPRILGVQAVEEL
jgi:arginyl-tRNA synthetase